MKQFSSDHFQRGLIVDSWVGASIPKRTFHEGKYVRLERLEKRHIAALYKTLSYSPEYDWYYMPFGPFHDQSDFFNALSPYLSTNDPLFFAVLDLQSNDLAGFLSFLNIKPNAGSIEIGFIQFAKTLQQTTGATESIWLLISHAFELGYRRVEWKCDSLNQRSQRAAVRLGFKFEGIFRQALVVKGRNRDTAWYSIIDKDWVELKKVYDFWLCQLAVKGEHTSLSKLTSNL